MPKDNQDRWNEWYGKNRDPWNKKRRDRYKNDPEYRALVLARSKKFRSTQRQSQHVEQRERDAAILFEPVNRWKTTKARKKVMFTIGALASRLGVSVQALRLWEKRGLIPAPTQRSVGNNRLYTKEQIDAFVEKFQAEGRPPVGKRKRRSEQGELWVVRLDDGEEVQRLLFTVGFLAGRLHKTSVTVNLMERKGYLPPTTLRVLNEDDGKEVEGRRLYTEEQIESVVKAYAPRSGLRSGRVWEEFRAEVEKAWTGNRCSKAVLVRRVRQTRGVQGAEASAEASP